MNIEEFKKWVEDFYIDAKEAEEIKAEIVEFRKEISDVRAHDVELADKLDTFISSAEGLINYMALRQEMKSQ